MRDLSVQRGRQVRHNFIRAFRFLQFNAGHITSAWNIHTVDLKDWRSPHFLYCQFEAPALSASDTRAILIPATEPNFAF